MPETFTAQDFRQKFPEFANGSDYPGGVVDFWIELALKLVNNHTRWGSFIQLGQMLFVAHNLVLEKQAIDESVNGSVPGIGKGPVNNQSVDKVSVGYDTGSAMEPDAGHWNLTIYGTRYLRLARMVGTGGVQVGIGSPESSGAWSGPWSGNFPNFNT